MLWKMENFSIFPDENVFKKTKIHYKKEADKNE